MAVPESLKMRPALSFKGEEYHDREAGGHDPTSDPRSRSKVGAQKCDEFLTCAFRLGVCIGKSAEIYHVGENMYNSPENDGPGGCLVKGDALIERNDLVEWGATEERDEVPTDGKQYKCSINV